MNDTQLLRQPTGLPVTVSSECSYHGIESCTGLDSNPDDSNLERNALPQKITTVLL